MKGCWVLLHRGEASVGVRPSWESDVQCGSPVVCSTHIHDSICVPSPVLQSLSPGTYPD